MKTSLRPAATPSPQRLLVNRLTDARLDLTNKMIETLGNIRRSVGEVLDLPKWPRNGDGTSVN
jgi:hypothetical protein